VTENWGYGSGGETSSVSVTTYSGNLTTLAQLNDTNIVTPSNLQLLQFQTGDNKWHPYTFSLGNWWDYDYADLINKPSTTNIFDQNLNTTDNVEFVNVTSTGYFLGDGSQLTNLPAGSEVDPYWTDNFTLYNSSWSPDGYEANTWDTSWLANWTAYNSSWSPDGYEADTDTFVGNYSDFLTISAWNDTGLIQDWNATGYIKDWSGNYLTLTQLLNFGYYNSTDFSISDYFTKANILGFNYYNSTDFSISDYYLKSNPYAYYNVTTLPDLNSTGLIINWSGDYLTEEVDPFWSANYTAYNDSWSTDTDTTYSDLSEFNDDILWTSTFNATGDTRWLTEETTWLANYSDFLDISIWNDTGLIQDWNATGLIINWSGDYLTEETLWNANYSDFLGKADLSDILGFNYYNSTDFDYTDYLLISNWNSTNSSYFLTSNYNVSGLIKDWTVDLSSYATTSYVNLQNTSMKNYVDGTFQPIGSYLIASDLSPYTTLSYLTSAHYNKTELQNIINNGTYTYDWNSTGLIQNWSVDLSSYLTSEDLWNANYSDFLTVSSWNDTGLIKDWQPDIVSANTTLYNWVVGQNYLTSFTETDPFWTANQSSYSTKTVADTLYAPINYGDNWNKTYADTLYQPTGSYLTSESDPLAYNGTLAYNSSLANYYLASNPSNFISDGNTNWDNSYGFINWGEATNGTLALTSSLSNYATNVKVDSLGNWTLDKTSYSTTSQANALYYAINNPSGFYNSTDFQYF